MQDRNISGGPGWLDATAWRIEATSNTAPLTEPQLRAMVRSLVEDRFHVSARRENREESIYELLVAKEGPKLREAAAPGPPRLSNGRGRIGGHSIDTGILAKMLSGRLGRAVVDKTGLTGKFDVDLTWTPAPGERDDGELAGALPNPDGPTLFTALQEQLGLRLQSGKGPVSILLIERAEKPDANTARPAAPSRTSPTGLRLECCSLRTLIQQAYDVFASGKPDLLNPGTPAMPIEGLPSGHGSALYSIDAKTDSPQTAAMMRGPMMQALLQDRFHLKLHREEREVPVYLMTVAPGRLKLQPAKEGSCAPYDFSEALNIVPSGQVFCGVPAIGRKGPLTILEVHGVTLKAFAKSLHPDGRPVIDETGLAGVFDIHLEWGLSDVAQPTATAGVAKDPSPHATAVEALRGELGLRLTSGKANGDFLVIDHIEKPSDN